MIQTPYDEASRYLLERSGSALVLWLLKRTPEQVEFVEWLNPILTTASNPQRICDAAGSARDRKRNGYPVLILTEIQTIPDPLMFGRLLEAGGLAWRLLKPTEHPGDRFDLATLVVNLTGRGDSNRRMHALGTSCVLKPRERNVGTMIARQVLNGIDQGTVPAEALAWIPLMVRHEVAYRSDATETEIGTHPCVLPQGAYRDVRPE